jgi:hypothetical protein
MTPVSLVTMLAAEEMGQAMIIVVFVARKNARRSLSGWMKGKLTE